VEQSVAQLYLPFPGYLFRLFADCYFHDLRFTIPPHRAPDSQFTEHNMSPSAERIGKADFGKTQFMFGAAGSLYSLEPGDLYRTNPSNGTWAALGQGRLGVHQQ
jgi:hypothetical protein